MPSHTARIADLSKEKQALLLKRIKERSVSVHQSIAKRADVAPCPLSFAQERLWFLAQMEPDNPFYNMAGAVQVQGNLNVPVLEQALNEVVRRHEALRTTFRIIEDEARQVITDSVAITVDAIDLTALNAIQQEDTLKILEAQEAHRIFDLEQTPLLRAVLVQLDDERYVLLMNLHHIVSDEWSLRLLIKEVGTYYQAFKNGNPSLEPELPIQYADFAVWQRGELHDKQIAYWKQYLEAAPTALELPTDRPRASVMSYRGENYEFELNPETSVALIRLSRQADTTLFVVMMAAFNVLLSRCSGQDDICVGYPIANRNRRDIENLIGFFVNTQVLRTDLSGNPTFTELLDRVRKNTLDAQNNQDLPFERLIEALKLERELNRTPLFQTMLVYQNAPMDALSITELHFKLADANMNAAKFDLTLNVSKSEDTLRCGFNYSTDLFDAATMVRMAEHLQQLLEGIVKCPDVPVSELPLLTLAERWQVLLDWNATEVDYPKDRYIHQLFEAQAEKTPDAVAVVFEGQTQSYSELNARANQLAHYLQGKGVGPDVLVGICVERSVEMVVGLLGILKAGGAYLPLDPSYPQDRLEFMLSDVAPPVVLTQAGLLERHGFGAAKVLCLDSDWPKLANEIATNPGIKLRPENLAYCIYTSGSTGQPKGAGVPHQGILNRLQWMQQQYRLDAGDCILQKTPYSFDVSVWEFFWPLMTGAQLVVAKPDEHKDSLALIDTIMREQVSTIHFVPSMLQAFIDTPGVENCTSLKRVICSGEALPADLVSRFQQKLPAELHNLYGPTEASVDVSYWPCVPGSAETAIPIGRPIANISLYILDRQLNPVPVGTPGELHIGGIGLARGYLNRPGLTAEKFIPNPYDQQGRRLYKTGDLVRYRPDGNIDYLGRIDHQVKIRGFRIELGEIEARLLEHPAIKETAVIAREDQPGDKRLAAYLVAAHEDSPDSELLKAWLREALPEYMVPSVFVALQSMPLSANGKLDRKRLPQPDRSSLSMPHYQHTQTPDEGILADIWRELLAVERVGRHDNFFELGGDSIMSIQVVSRARQAGVVISPKLLFQHQTVATLALAAGQNRRISAEQWPVFGKVPLTPIQQWFFEQNLGNPHHWNQALFLEVNSGLTADILERAVKQLLIHHDALRMRFSRESGDWQQHMLKAETQAVFERIDLSGVPAERQATLLESAASIQQARLHLSEGPLLRAAWFDLGEGKGSRVLIVIHHLVVDGVSWRILLEDLAVVCRQLMSGQTPELPAKTTSFKQWSEQIVEQVSSGGLQLDKAYWLDARRNPVLVLPVDRPGGDNRVAMEEEVTVMLTDAETRALLQDVPGAYRTRIDDVLLTALTLTLRDWMHCESVLIDLEGHGREDIVGELDVSRTVGWFTTVYPALLSIADDASLGDALKAVKEQLRAIPINGMSYGLLRYVAQDAEFIVQQPKAQLMFNYLGQLDTVMAADAPFVPSREATGLSCDPAGIRTHELAIVGTISEGRMQLSWRYSRERYRKDTIENLAGNYLRQLKALIAHCLLPDSGGYTPSDFPLAALAQSGLDAMALKPRRIEDIYPLAPLQSGLMFHSFYDPEPSVYCIQLGCRLLGELNVPAFKQAWQQLVDHHPVLRTRFQLEHQDQPLQIVHKQAQLPITEYDWRADSAPQQTLRWRQLLADDQAKGFDFTRAPLMRLGLVQCSDKEYYFLWSYHHVLLDGWSGPLLLKGVFAAYEALRRGEEALLPAVRPYRDYIGWLQNQALEAAEAYWRTALSGFTAPTPLIIDKSIDNIAQQHGYAKHSLTLSAAQSQALQSFVKQQQLTLNTLVQGAWAVLLSRYSGDNDVAFGVTVSGRPADLIGVEDMVGLFINTLPLRIKIAPDCTTLEGLQAILAQNQEMRAYEFAPLTQIQGWSEVPRGTALFESLLVFENYPIDQALTENFAGLAIDAVSVVDQTNYPLTLSAYPGTTLHLEISYAAGRFEAETVKRMLLHLQGLLDAFVEQPQTRLSELSLLSVAERQQILLDWNATAVDYPQGRFIHQLFEAQAEKTPDALAIVFEGQTLSYAELNVRANRLAHYLRGKGVGPDVLVGICVERSLEMVIGLLGILKAGGAYVPLDPDYPQDRLDFMVHDVGAPIVLSQESCKAKLAASTAAVLCLDSEWELVADADDKNPDILLMPENLAYCIYTSGSTGQPKGAGVPHQGILNRLQWMQESYSLKPTDRVLQKTPYSFDVSVWEFFWPLMTGAQLIVAEPDAHQDALALIDIINRRQITTLHFVPSMLQAFIGTPGVETCTSLKRVICSGEALPADLVTRFQQKLPAELHNLYGPTEASVDVSYWACLPGCVEAAIPIGRPIANISLYILDRQLNPVAVGTPGELHIGGIGLGRGYLNRPGLTAEKFIPNPYGSAGSRLYKTGDWVRYRADGNIDYLGRIDHQVKIRGFRIELGEIEAQLVNCQGVREAVVIAREDKPNDKRLVAYLLTQNNIELSAAELRSQLAEVLADYMIPGAFVCLAEFPLMPNGKLNRKALPAPGIASVITRRYEAPQGDVEMAVAAIWQDLLGLERIGRHDHFFELGGHSLMVVTLIERLRQQGLSADVRTVFITPTLEAMAAAIDANKHRSHVFEAPPNLIPTHFEQSLTNTEEFRL
ncbi:MAG: amino acid adenylation domain-containing protein [Methylobacter sp.]|nr:amino acid adenylation domain-containing protein [Methylobacter sp.]MDP2427362.1 amino acid adenylation domain-containing protein [Methylobacter sp.]MDP3055396.1 amino acid adenylation domain-containing protein [Methylobacter sp.]MDP3362283.1 amino acid adenylation domain-containing protein [Methylobacter sp.]MDZ4217509.1 amino acid adenylation domain-containing protein [Methylobacter sp.]